MYYIVFGFLYLISLLPFFILYRISDLTFVILYFITGYRKEVVMKNLKDSFPEKTEGELKIIARKFYRNFTDNWIETIKLISISKTALNKRVSANVDIFHRLYKEGKAVQLNLGHFFNWELMSLYTGINQPYTLLMIYLPLTSEIVNRLFIYLRSRWGNPQVPSSDMSRIILPWRKKQFSLGLVADQNPPVPTNAYWLNFLNKPTAFIKGSERFARILNIPVVMMTTTRPRRGHYHFEYFLLTENPQDIPDGELIRLYVQQLQENIRLQPEIYLWSHRRWKKPWKDEYENLWVDKIPPPKQAENN